jgi:glutamate-1-semialdehyde aminotransferase
MTLLISQSSMAENSRQQNAQQSLAIVLREASGLDLDKMNRSATFLELGFGVKIAFRQLIEDVSTVDALIAYMAEHGNFESAGISAASPQKVQVATAAESSSVATLVAAGPFVVPQLSAIAASWVASKSPVSLPTAVASSNASQVTSPAPTQLAVPPFQHAPINQPQQSSQFSVPAPAPVVWSNPVTGPAVASSALEQIIIQQNQLMLRHLEILCGQPIAAPVNQVAHGAIAESCTEGGYSEPACDSSGSFETEVCNQICAGSANPFAFTPTETSTVATSSIDATQAIEQASEQATQPAAKSKVFERFGPYKPVRRGNIQGLTDTQHQHLKSFIDRFTKRTAKSRKHAQSYRTQFADPRGVAGYRRIWKSMVYQIVVEKSKGSKLWDIDGNEYVDIAMGFGLNLFGQSPDFVTQALHQQLDRGVEVGPQTPLTGEVASLLCQFSRQDRVTFCNTGSEAVMAALRLARTVTGKTKTVFFNKDYHGNFDQVLMRSQSPSQAQAGSAPAAPGVPQWYADNTIVLPYGAEESLRVIEENADDIAAVLVEPCQSADPFIQPIEFLTRLRAITRERQIALVMDEVITGFRAAQGGAQEWYGVWGDMATYGKILGGGMPIGALAGSKEYMDALDGGDWRYEDDSEPDADMTFFAGTFVRHPLAIAAAYEVLKKVKEEGPQLQARLTARTTHLANILNRFFEEEQFPIRVAQFTSLFRFMFPPDLEFADMLYFHMLHRGIFTRGWGDNCFLSTAHSDEDIEKVIKAVKESCLEIRGAGFFPDKDPTDRGLESKKKLASPTHRQSKQNSVVSIPMPSLRAVRDQDDESFKFDPDRMSTVNPIQESGTRPPLFCMPAADGLTLVYHELAKELGEDQPVYGLDSPAIYREPIPETLEELAARFIADLKEVQPEGPYYLIGYCSGGTTALEVAQQLIRSGDQVAMLALIETYNWLTLPSTKPTTWVQMQYQYERLKFHFYNFWLLDAKLKSKFLKSKFQSLIARTKVWRGAISSLFRKQSSRHDGLVNMAEIWRKHDEIAEAYVPQNYPGRLIHFRPLRDYKCNIGTEYEANEIDYRTMKVYPAGMMADPFVKELAAQMDQVILQSFGKSVQDSELERA